MANLVHPDYTHTTRIQLVPSLKHLYFHDLLVNNNKSMLVQYHCSYMCADGFHQNFNADPTQFKL